MSRRSLSLLILAILLCCHGWTAVMQDVLLAQAGMTEGVTQERAETGMASSVDQGHDSSSLQHNSSSGEPDLDDASIVGLLDFSSTAILTAYRYRTSSAGSLPFRWLERPMRPPCPAALLT